MDKLSQAHDLVWKAYEARSKAERIKLCKKALEVCPDCADGYVMLAQDSIEDTKEDTKERISFFEEGEKPDAVQLVRNASKKESAIFG